MPPMTLWAANSGYNKAINKPVRTTQQLEYYLPNPPSTQTREPPPERPRERERTDSVTACPECTKEIQNLPIGNRSSHVCTHVGNQGADGDARSGTGSDTGRRGRGSKSQQPKAGIIRECINNVDNALDGLSDAVAVLVTVLSDRQTKEDYQDHLVTWVEHCEYLKERGREVIEVLEAA